MSATADVTLQIGLRAGNTNAWYIHPDTKPAAFVELLPKLLTGAREGIVPPTQRGSTGLRFEDWRGATLSPVA